MPLVTALWVIGIGRGKYPAEYVANNGTCQVHHPETLHFCEGAMLWRPYGLALLSCDPGRAEWNLFMGPMDKPDPRGSIYIYDYAGSKAVHNVELVGFPTTSDFHPLGFDLYEADGKASLFVINHQRTGPSIEVFDVTIPSAATGGTAAAAAAAAAGEDAAVPRSADARISGIQAHYKRTIPEQELIKSANSLTAMSHDSLYVTNDHAWTLLHNGLVWALIETFSTYPLSWISHVQIPEDITQDPVVTKAFQGIAFPNGIDKGHDGKTLYVASWNKGHVYVFNIPDPEPAAAATESPTKGTAEPHLLRLIDELQFGYAVDNLDVYHVRNDTGHLEDIVVVGGHPDFISMSKAGNDPHKRPKLPSASWIAMAQKRTPAQLEEKIPPRTKEGFIHPWRNKRWETTTIYQNDGKAFRTVSGGAIDVERNVLISSGIYEDGVLHCTGIV